MVITATQIKIKSIVGFFRFIPRVRNIRTQLSSVDGLVFVKIKGLRTLTGWESREAMEVFRNKDHHLDAMKNIRNIGKAKSITWEAESETDWREAKKKLKGVEF